MSYRAIYAYPWNLADEGVSAVVEAVHALGIDTITVAGSYYAVSGISIETPGFLPYHTKRRIHGAGRRRGIIRPGFPDLISHTEMVDAAQALRDAGISEVAFYNYGHLRRSNINWIADALAVFGDA